MSEGNSWKTPATVIGIIALLLTAAGVYISKQGSDRETEKQQYDRGKDERDRLGEDRRDEEKQNRIAELNNQLKQAEGLVQESETAIQTTYRQIQKYDFKRNDPSASDYDRAEDNKEYLIFRENLNIFSKQKQQRETRVDELRKEINDLIK
jgi:uncharacterized protein HemX